MNRKRIACVHIPRFAVEAERRRPLGSAQGKRPDLASRLVLIGEATVFDCSLGAETSNVKRGMRMSEAIGLCHQAIVLPPDAPYYERLFEELLDFLGQVSPDVERAGLGTAYLALDGLAIEVEPFAEELVSALHREFALMASLGVANGKFPARVAAQTTRPGAIKVVSCGQEKEFLAPLSAAHLPASEAMLWRLGLLGLGTIGEIAQLPLGAFQAQFGPEGKRCWELAQGIDSEPLVPRVKEETLVRRLQMPAPAVTLEPILAGIERLVHSAYSDSERGGRPDGHPSGRWVRKVVVRAALDGGGTWELPVAFREALADPQDAWFAIKSAVLRRPPERPVEELELEMVGLSTESGKQRTMFDAKGKLWLQVQEAVRQLAAQQGQMPVGKVMEVEPWSRIPERRAALADFEP